MRKLFAAIAALPATLSGMLRIAKRLDTIRRKQPHIDISQGSWATPNPKVHVSMHSASGMIGLYTYDDDDAGNAGASLNASSLANITGLRIVDRRPVATNEAHGSLLAREGAVWLPRDHVIVPVITRRNMNAMRKVARRRLARG